MKIQGLYSCSCHPFKSQEELNRFNRQKIVIGGKYRNRCTGKVGIATRLNEDNPNYAHLFCEPYDCARCNTIDHKQNLILCRDS